MQEQNEPGAVITPGSTGAVLPPPAPQSPVAQPMPASPQQPSPAPVATQQEQPPVISSPEPTATYSADPGQNSQFEDSSDQEGLFMTWRAQELDEHNKNSSWYAMAFLVAIILTAVVFFLTEKDILVSLAVFLAVVGFAYLASHKPKEQDYALAQEGIYIGNKLRSFDEFKNFSEIEDVSGPTIVLIPHKRFSSPLVLRLTRETIDQAVNTLSQFLPVEQRKPDAVDQLMRRIRL